MIEVKLSMKENLIKREPYSDLLKETIDDNCIKIITGVRCSWKSTLLKMLANDLRKTEISDEQIVYLDFEQYRYRNWSDQDLYDCLIQKSKEVNNQRIYLFLDEIQVVKNWERAVNSLKNELDIEIFITSSNAAVKSCPDVTLLSERTVMIELFPFSFREYLKVRGVKIERNLNRHQLENWNIYDKNKNQLDSKLLLEDYLKFGGLPVLNNYSDHDLRKLMQLEDVINTVILRDLIEIRFNSGRSSVSNVVLLDHIYHFILSHIGQITSVNKIVKFLNSQKLTNPHYHNQTIQNYLSALEESYLIYKLNRFDIKGKRILSKLDKYYSVDPGLRFAVIEDIESNRGYILENVVFLELKRRGFEIAVGKNNNLEIDFFASKEGKKYFIQVTESLENPDVKEREIKPLQNLKDVGRKIILTNQDTYQSNIEDIEVIRIIDFLLDYDNLN